MNIAQNTEKKLLARIYGNGRGWAFSQNDFAALGSREAIDKALSRLALRSSIRRVIRGIYDYPRYSELLKREVGPDIHQVALALGRKFKWSVQPGGAAALNMLGLSTQIPSRYIYLSDGPDRTYQIGERTLTFKHLAMKDWGFKHDESAIIVAALKELGEERIDEQVLSTIRKWLPVSKRKPVLKETNTATGWVYAAIKRICREEDDG